jgi:hypothetical protein
MNSKELNRLGKLIEEGAVPAWVRHYVDQHREEMIAKLNAGQPVGMRGPRGEEITVRPAA